MIPKEQTSRGERSDIYSRLPDRGIGANRSQKIIWQTHDAQLLF